MAVRDDSTVRIIEELNTKINFETIFWTQGSKKCPKMLIDSFVVEVPNIILWGARNTVSIVILVISFSLNQVERKQKFITLWKKLFKKYICEV